LIQKGEEERKAIRKLVQEELGNLKKDMPTVTRAEFEELRARVEQLEKRMEQSE